MPWQLLQNYPFCYSLFYWYLYRVFSFSSRCLELLENLWIGPRVCHFRGLTWWLYENLNLLLGLVKLEGLWTTSKKTWLSFLLCKNKEYFVLSILFKFTVIIYFNVNKINETILNKPVVWPETIGSGFRELVQRKVSQNHEFFGPT